MNRSKLLGLAMIVFTGGCTNREDSSPTVANALPPTPWIPAAAAHAGLGTPPERGTLSCRAAVDAALGALAEGADALDAAVAGVRVLEDDPQLNAGLGSRVRLDGETVQMDATLMHSDGRFGAVGVVERVQNPIRVARAVIDTPHLVIAGDGATRLARASGLPDFEPATEDRRLQVERLRKRLMARDFKGLDGWKDYDWTEDWNFKKSLVDLGIEADFDTVGVIVRDAQGHFAVGLSTGGGAIMLRGRIGDVPVYGAGAWAGERGAVAATGTGERIMEQLTARGVHHALEDGERPQVAADHAVDAVVSDGGAVGLIVLTPKSVVMAADRSMAWAGRELGSPTWLGTEP